MSAQMYDWPSPPPKTRLAALVAICCSLVLFGYVVYAFVQDWQRIFDLGPVQLEVFANLPESGGWQGAPSGLPLRVERGRRVQLTVSSVAGTHSFALAHTRVQSSRVLAPGEQETVEFVTPAPGRYVFYCTTWCSPNHWRMRTVLEVYDPADPDAPLVYPQEPPRYPLVLDELPLDVVYEVAPQSAPTWPIERPSAATGATLWERLAPAQIPQETLAALGWPVVTPAEVYERLNRGNVPGVASAQTLNEFERWSLVAYLWQQGSTSASLARGAELFQQNCADCHGETGKGDGFVAVFSPEQEPNFADPHRASLRSPAVYYAKIARGGMGTGMPNWGTILDEDDLWALTAYLHSFLFDHASEE